MTGVSFLMPFFLQQSYSHKGKVSIGVIFLNTEHDGD